MSHAKRSAGEQRSQPTPQAQPAKPFASLTLPEKLDDKDYRAAYASAQARHFIAHQIRAIRKLRRMEQKDLAERIGTKQPVISRIENPEYGRVNLQTLLDVAEAFDVALIVRFAAFDDLLRLTANVSPAVMAIPDYQSAKSSRAASTLSFNVAPGGFGTIRQVVRSAFETRAAEGTTRAGPASASIIQALSHDDHEQNLPMPDMAQ